VYESRELIVIKMEAAGLKPGDAEVLVENDVVTIRGARLDRCSLAKLAFHQAEVRYGRFERRLRISVPFDADRIRAELADGFLEVIVPKADPPSRRVVKVSLTV
jgi:HSP20 family protein